jgi:hypothetical protein
LKYKEEEKTLAKQPEGLLIVN